MDLSIRGLSKTYPNGVRALSSVDLEIPPGMFGLLGPNGAGKSTLMRTIATLQEPDEGAIRLGDIDVLTDKHRVRQLLGYLPQEFGVYPKVSAELLLDHLASLKGVTDRRERKRAVDELLALTNLEAHRKKAIGGFSGGMKQRFGIAQALVGDPRLIIVDEPTAGLDPEERVRFHNLLSEIGEDRVVILSTHIVSDVSELCASMAIINKGEVLLTARPLEAIAMAEGRIWKCFVDKQQLEEYEARHEVVSTRLVMGRTLVHVWAESQPGDEFESVEPDLEDVYFATIRGLLKPAGAPVGSA